MGHAFGNAEPLVPAYYWAGKGSAIVHHRKGFGRPVNARAYREAYSPERLAWLRDAFGVNCVFLAFNWGLPPEIEEDDWDAFAQAAATAHELGMRAVAYVQPSNAMAMGSYAHKRWYATTPKGKRIPYYNGRYFTCLNNPEWRETVLCRVKRAVAAGADGIFLDNCAFGGMPVPLSRDFTAFAGCFCARCQASFGEWQRARGMPIRPVPRLFRPGRDPHAREFAHWRAWVLLEFLRTVKATIKQVDPGVVLLTNTVGAVNVNTYNVFGVDLPEIARVVDWLFVENLQSPRSEAGLLVQNAGTYKLLQSLNPSAPTLSIAYERGIGVDGVPPPATFSRTLAEGYAAGGVPVVRAAEYIEDGQWTLLEPPRHDAQARAVRRVVSFAREHPEVFRDRRSAARVGVYVPPNLAWRGDVFPEAPLDYLGVIQALIAAAIPFQILTSLATLEGIDALVTPSEAAPPPGYSGRVVPYSELGIRKNRQSLFDYFAGPLEPALRVLGPRVIDGYYSRVHVRRFVDRLDLLFRLVFRDQFEPLEMDSAQKVALASTNPVSIRADGYVYADLWSSAPGRLQLHLVNYENRPVRVRVTAANHVLTGAITPDGRSSHGGSELFLSDYAVLDWEAVTLPAGVPGVETRVGA